MSWVADSITRGYKGLQGEVIGFYNDYKNLLGSDLAATGGTGTLDQFNAGEVRVSGLEIQMNYNPLNEITKKFRLPLLISYTYTDTEFLNSFESDTDIFGEVTAGDEIPYIAKHQLNLNIALEHKKFDLSAGARYTSAIRTQAGAGPITGPFRVDSNLVIDVSGRYFYNRNFTLSANIINLLDETYAVARVPAGLRPGHPFGINAGFRFSF